MLVTQIPVLLQSLVDDAFQIGWHFGIQPHRRSWRPIQDRFENDGGTLSAERQCARRHLIQHCAEGEQIAPRIQFLSARLLWRHISDCAQRRTRAGQVLFVGRHRADCRNLVRRTGRGRDLCQPEIEDLGVTALGDKDVGGFDVAVDDPFGMGCLQCVGNLNRHTK